MAEWWINECGGLLCSNCGFFHDDYYDDYYDSAPPDKCERCGSIMTFNCNIQVDKEYRLSTIGSECYMDENKYPAWLLQLLREKREREEQIRKEKE